MLMFICAALTVILLLHVSSGSQKSFQSTATPVLFSIIIYFLCFQTNKPDEVTGEYFVVVLARKVADLRAKGEAYIFFIILTRRSRSSTTARIACRRSLRH